MIRKRGWLLLIALSVGTIAACGDKSGSTGSPSGSAAAADKKKGKKTPSPKNKKADAGKAKKGGDNKDAKPAAESKKANEKTLDAPEKKKADAAVVGDKDPCADLPDGLAECHDATILFCKEKATYVLDCNQFAKDSARKLGSCFEGEKGTDCMLCGAVEGAGQVCCDLSGTICCTDAGDCFEPDPAKEAE